MAGIEQARGRQRQGGVAVGDGVEVGVEVGMGVRGLRRQRCGRGQLEHRCTVDPQIVRLSGDLAVNALPGQVQAQHAAEHHTCGYQESSCKIV